MWVQPVRHSWCSLHTVLLFINFWTALENGGKRGNIFSGSFSRDHENDILNDVTEMTSYNVEDKDLQGEKASETI